MLLNLIKMELKQCLMAVLLNISSSISNNKVIIRIEDSGIGMSQEQINRFGEPYFSTKRKVQA